jgi:hypothetical protein
MAHGVSEYLYWYRSNFMTATKHWCLPLNKSCLMIYFYHQKSRNISLQDEDSLLRIPSECFPFSNPHFSSLVLNISGRVLAPGMLKSTGPISPRDRILICWTIWHSGRVFLHFSFLSLYSCFIFISLFSMVASSSPQFTWWKTQPHPFAYHWSRIPKS